MTVKAKPRGVAQFEATVRELSEQVAKARLRTARMEGATTDRDKDLPHDPTALREALEEIRVHQEELAVADEALRAQLDALGHSNLRARAERDRYQQLFDLAPDAYFVTDRLGVIRDANASGARILAIEARFLIGKPLAALIDIADTRTLREGIEMLRTKPAIELEVRLRPRNAEPHWYILKAVPIEAETALLWIAHDVHARHAASVRESPPTSVRIAELERVNRDLEELLQRERRLREELASADAAKDRFIAVLSHDLRAPLNAVLGWTQLLRREPLDQSARDRALATIEQNAQAQIRLIEELLDVSRIAGNKMQLERTTLDLTGLVRRSVDAVLPHATECGVDVNAVIGSGILVVGDRRRLEQAMANLLSNALKFTPRGGRVTVVLERDGQSARITAQDTGRGIAPEYLPSLFDPFRQVGDHTTPRDGRSGWVPGERGLGLYVVHRAVEMHGGSVSVQSDGVGRGARFTVLLPLVASSAPPAPSFADGARAGGPELLSLEGVRVLVVDDDDDSRELLAALLRQAGALVTAASDVATALHAFQTSAPAVVVTEVGMRGHGSLDLMRELGARNDGGAAFVAIGGNAGQDDVEHVLAAGFDVHVAKPIDPAELVAALVSLAGARNRAH